MITGIGFKHEKFNFPCGEMQVKITEVYGDKRVSAHFAFEKNEDIIELLLVADALKRMGLILEGISMPYIPFSRQDRANQKGEALSLAVFCTLINRLGASVEVCDPHSDVAVALLDRVKVRQQHEIFAPMLAEKSDFYLVSPDGGALKKIYKLAEKVRSIGVVECSKNRDVRTGAITGVTAHTDDLRGKDCYIVDDICDGGRTFIEVAKVLKEKNAGKIVLMVTHGFFTKGLGVFDLLIDEIYNMNGRVK